MARKVSWGVLGAADIGLKRVIPGMQRGEVSRVDAIASRDLAKAQAAASAHGIAQAYGSYEELLADPAIEAIYNPLPNELHVPWTIRALEAGKHVLCEKPIALDADEAQALVAARARTGKLVAEAFMVRHHPQWRRAREIARSGAIGEARAIQTFFAYRLLDADNIRNKPPGGGALYDIGCYAILTARYVFGAEPTRVVASLDVDPKFGTDRLASALIEFPGGRHLTFTCATQIQDYQRVTIVGEAGRVEVAVPFNALIDRPMRITIDSGADLVGGGAKIEEFPVCDQYTLQGDAFSRAVLGRSAARIPDRGRDRQHARHRRGVPLGARAAAGRSRKRARQQHGGENDRAAGHLQRRHPLAQHGPGRQRRERRLGEDHQGDDADRRAAHRHRGQPLSQRVDAQAEQHGDHPAERARRDQRLAVQPSRDGEDDGRDRGRPHRRRHGVEPKAELLDQQEIARVGDRRAKRERVAEADARRGDHSGHRPGAEQRQAERQPDPRRRTFAEEQRAADDGEDRPDRADESGVGDLGAGQRDVEEADVEREGEAGEDQQAGGTPGFRRVALIALDEPRQRRQRRRRRARRARRRRRTARRRSGARARPTRR